MNPQIKIHSLKTKQCLYLEVDVFPFFLLIFAVEIAQRDGFVIRGRDEFRAVLAERNAPHDVLVKLRDCNDTL